MSRNAAKASNVSDVDDMRLCPYQYKHKKNDLTCTYTSNHDSVIPHDDIDIKSFNYCILILNKAHSFGFSCTRTHISYKVSSNRLHQSKGVPGKFAPPKLEIVFDKVLYPKSNKQVNVASSTALLAHPV